MRRDSQAVLLLLAFWAVAIAVVGLGGDCPHNDDFAYSWSARHLAQTGDLRILDWAAPSLVTHTAWGGALMRLFGETHVVLRAGTLGFAAIGLVLLYLLGRRSGFTVGQALLLALATGFCPWFLNLSFTYMSEVPWLTLMLGALLAMACARGGGSARLVLCGLCLGAAALSRQPAVITLPAFLLVAVLDARAVDREDAKGWMVRALVRMALIALPVIALYAAYHLWYTRVHLPTLANRETWTRMRQVTVLRVVVHTFATWCYLGFFIAPLTVGLLWGRARRTALRAWPAALVLVLFVAVALWQPWSGRVQVDRGMPYFGNVIDVLTAGPRTHAMLDDRLDPPVGTSTKRDIAGAIHTGLSVAGGALVALFLVGAAGAIRRTARKQDALDDRARVRVLLVGGAALYLLWLLATTTILYDRYLLFTVPVALWLALDALPPTVATAPATLVTLALLALFSVGTAREYQSWTDARERAARDLERRGVSVDDLDGGFETNGARHYFTHFARTGELMPDGYFWVRNTRWRLAFRTHKACRTDATYPHRRFLLDGPHAIFVLECPPP